MHDNISILVVNVPQVHPLEDRLLRTDIAARRKSIDGKLETPFYSVSDSQRVATALDWSKFNPDRLRAVMIKISEDVFDKEAAEAYLRRMAEGMERAGMALDLLCVACARRPVVPLYEEEETGQQEDEDFENDPALLGSAFRMRVNPAPILKGVVRPGGRIVFVDSEFYWMPHSQRRPCEFGEMSLVL